MSKAKMRIVAAFAALLLLAIVVIVLFPLFTDSKIVDRATTCLSRLKQSDLAVLMYADDCDGRMPHARSWASDTLPYSKSKDIYACPDVSRHDPKVFGHAFRSSLGLKTSLKISNLATQVAIFDATDLSWNANGPLSLLSTVGRHAGGLYGIAFADGHASYQTRDHLFTVVQGTSGPKD